MTNPEDDLDPDETKLCRECGDPMPDWRKDTLCTVCRAIEKADRDRDEKKDRANE